MDLFYEVAKCAILHYKISLEYNIYKLNKTKLKQKKLNI